MPWQSGLAESRKARTGHCKSFRPTSSQDIGRSFSSPTSKPTPLMSVDATLQVVSPNAYWYVDDELDIPEDELQRAAGDYEANVRPVLLEAFGDVWNPGVDGDPRLTVLHTDLGGSVAGVLRSSP